MEPIGSISGFAPVLVIDRTERLGFDTIRFAQASEVSSTPTNQPRTSQSTKAPDFSEEKAITARLGRRFEVEASLTFESQAVPLSQAEVVSRFQKLILFGSMELDVLV